MSKAPAGATKRTEKTYSADEVREAITAYVELGVYALAEKRTGIPLYNIRRWVNDPRWAATVREIKHAHAEAVRARFGAQATAFAESLELARRAAHEHLERLMAQAADGGKVDRTFGREVGALMRALGGNSESVTRIAGYVRDEAVIIQAGPPVVRSAGPDGGVVPEGA